MAKNGFSMSNRVATEELDAAKTLTADDCGKVFTLAKNSGFTVTLPSPGAAGNGWNCKFIVDTAISSNQYIISSSATTDHIKGGVLLGQTAGSDDAATAVNTAFFAPNGTNHTAIKLDVASGRTGGVVEAQVVANAWHLTGVLHASGTLETPFG